MKVAVIKQINLKNINECVTINGPIIWIFWFVTMLRDAAVVKVKIVNVISQQCDASFGKDKIRLKIDIF